MGTNVKKKLHSCVLVDQLEVKIKTKTYDLLGISIITCLHKLATFSQMTENCF